MSIWNTDVRDIQYLMIRARLYHAGRKCGVGSSVDVTAHAPTGRAKWWRVVTDTTGQTFHHCRKVDQEGRCRESRRVRASPSVYYCTSDSDLSLRGLSYLNPRFSAPDSPFGRNVSDTHNTSPWRWDVSSRGRLFFSYLGKSTCICAIGVANVWSEVFICMFKLTTALVSVSLGYRLLCVNCYLHLQVV